MLDALLEQEPLPGTELNSVFRFALFCFSFRFVFGGPGGGFGGPGVGFLLTSLSMKWAVDRQCPTSQKSLRLCGIEALIFCRVGQYLKPKDT